MSLLIIGITIGTIGKVLLGVAVFRVHWHIAKEHKIDGDVIRAIKRERIITLLGVMGIIAGYVFEMLFYSFVSIV